MFNNLKAELARKNMGSAELAEILGISRKSANNKLGGRTEFLLSEINTVSKIFPDCSISYLFDPCEEGA